MYTKQKETIKNHLIHNGKITPLEAWRKYSVYRLSSVIHRLRNENMKIKTTIKTSDTGKFGIYEYQK